MSDKTKQPSRRGRPPKFGKPMSAAERKRLSREKLAKEGAKEYMIKIEGIHLNAINQLSETSGIEPREVLTLVVTNAMDRLTGVMNRAQKLLDSGVSEEEVNRFITDNLYPQLPDIE